MSITEKRVKFAQTVKQTIDDHDFKSITNPEAIRTYVKTQEDLLEAFANKQKPTPDIMGVTRSSCTLCTKTCECYEPFEVFLLDANEQAYNDTFIPTLCRNCKCPAYFHPPVKKDLYFPQNLKDGLRNYVLKEDHLNFSGTLAVFEINYADIDAKKKNFKEQEDQLYDLMKHGGFSVICRSVKILNSEEKIKFGQNRGNFTAGADFFSAVVKAAQPKTSQNFAKTTFSSGWVKQDEPLLILCLSALYVNSQSQFCKFIRAANSYLPTGFKCLYGSQNSTQGFTDCSIFFPEIFTLKKFCILIPTEVSVKLPSEIDPIMSFFKTQSMKLKGKIIDDDKDVNLQRLGKIIDQLSFNGFAVACNTSGKVKDIKELQSVLEMFLPVNRAEYLSKFILANASDLKINLVAAGKVGIPLLLNLPGQSMDCFTFSKDKEIFHLYSYLASNMVTSSRSLLIFRPIAVRSGLDKVFLDVYKKNYFIVLAEEYKKLTPSEVEFLSLGLKVHLNDLLEVMTEGESHIVAVCKLGGFEEAEILANGCQFGRRRSEKRLLQQREFVIEHNKERNPFNMKYNEDYGLEKQEYGVIKEEVRVNHNLEEGSLFSLSPFSSIIESLDLDSIIDQQMKVNKHELDLQNFQIRQQEINRLRYFSRHFNVAMHTSGSLENSEKEILRFFPFLGLYSDVILVMKTEALALEQDFLRLLDCMKCKVIKATTEEGRNYYHISKLAGREEFIGVFEYNVNASSILYPHNLRSLFDLHIRPSEFEQSLSLISFPIKNLSFLDIRGLEQEVFFEILRYMLLVTSFEDLETVGIEWVYDYQEFIHYAIKVCTAQKTVRELRIRKLQNKAVDDMTLEVLELFDEYSVISWYYKEISKIFPKIVPEFYWFKIEPAERDAPITRVFTCSEFKGFIFLAPIWKMMQDHRPRETIKTQDRGSLVTFMWGRKLSLLADRIEILPTQHIPEFGPIYWNGRGSYQGFYTGNYFEFDCAKYKMYIDQLKPGWEDYAPIEIISEILKKFKQVLESEAFFKSRLPEHFGLVPEFTEFLNLRVFSYREKPNLSDIHYIDAKIAAMNELYDKVQAEMDTKDFALVDTFPSKYHKRHFAANILWLLKVYLKSFDPKDIELGTSEPEYQIFLESLKQGFLMNYSGDAGVDGVSLFYLEYFLFSLTMAWKILVEILEVQSKRDNLELGTFQANSELNKLRIEEERLARNLSIQLQELANIDFVYKPKSSETDFLRIDRERYFKHYMMKEYETNLNNPRYPNKIIRAKFPIVNPLLANYIKGSLSQVQQSWFNPISPKKQNLRPVPKHAFRFDSILVKKTKWMTHQRQQKLVKDAMMYLISSVTGINK